MRKGVRRYTQFESEKKVEPLVWSMKREISLTIKPS